MPPRAGAFEVVIWRFSGGFSFELVNWRRGTRFTQNLRRNLAVRFENRQIWPNLAVSKVRRQKKNRTVPSRKTVFTIRINQLAVFANLAARLEMP